MRGLEPVRRLNSLNRAPVNLGSRSTRVAAVGRLRHQQLGLDAGRRADPVLHRPGPPPAPAAAVTRSSGPALVLARCTWHSSEAALDPGRVNRTIEMGDQMMLRTKRPPRWESCARGGRFLFFFCGGGARRP